MTDQTTPSPEVTAAPVIEVTPSATVETQAVSAAEAVRPQVSEEKKAEIKETFLQKVEKDIEEAYEYVVAEIQKLYE